MLIISYLCVLVLFTDSIGLDFLNDENFIGAYYKNTLDFDLEEIKKLNLDLEKKLEEKKTNKILGCLLKIYIMYIFSYTLKN